MIQQPIQLTLLGIVGQDFTASFIRPATGTFTRQERQQMEEEVLELLVQ